MAKQIEFPEKQTHVKSFEQLCLLLSAVGIVVAIVAANVF